MLRKCVALLALCVVLAGCMYHVPLTPRLSAEKHAEAVAAEKEARRNGWKLFAAYVHSLHTCPFVASGRAISLTVPPLQVLSWPAQWTGVVKPHEEYLRKYWRESVDEEFHGDGDDSVPPDDELWMNRSSFWIWED